MSLAPLPSPALATALTELGLRVVDEHTVAGRTGRTVSVPAALHPATRARLTARHPVGVYAHQATAIERGLRGDLCLATSTASGKSLVFMTIADDLLTGSSTTRVLALYPTKALIEDQQTKWRQHFAGTDVGVAFIHGGVAMAQRWSLLESARVVLMTPDIVQAWVLSSLRDPRMQRYLAGLGLLVVDEAHAYEGVFGTNAAYLFRRLEAAARPFKLVASTATISDAGSFVRALTGRDVAVVGPEAESSPLPARRFVLCRPMVEERAQAPERAARLMRALTERGTGCTLAFADSRKTVERVLRALDDLRDDDGAGDDASAEVARRIASGTVLPYRSGYEDEDRRSIQHALARGDVRGVVATSALELGIDIGAIDVTVLLNVPPTVKAFRQRIGRAGRSGGPNATAMCILVDEHGVLPNEAGALADYLARAVEPSRLYLDNRFVMYGHALCAAREAQQAPRYDRSAFATLPRYELFDALIDNELRPTRAVDEDLLRLKQEAQDGPHHALPLRSAGEVELQVIVAGDEARRLGFVTHSQALREAYPGAVYVHLGQPWRVQRWAWGQRQIFVTPMTYLRQARTEPVRTDLVFPRPQAGGLLSVREGSGGRVFESVCQVSAHVRGFTLRATPNAHPEQHTFGVGSSWSQTALSRSFTTTCVVWTAANVKVGAAVANAIRSAYCARLGIHEQDLGVGSWQLDGWRGDGNALSGVCIYDAVQGSLRLGQQLVELFEEVVRDALANARANDDDMLADDLATLTMSMGALPTTVLPTDARGLMPSLQDDDSGPWLPVAPVGTRGLQTTSTGMKLAFTVRGYRFTPRGLAYVAQRDGSRTTEAVLAAGMTLEAHVAVEWNADTDEVRARSSAVDTPTPVKARAA
jgi:DEAD/DEAH box helicase domain-containing protein